MSVEEGQALLASTAKPVPKSFRRPHKDFPTAERVKAGFMRAQVLARHRGARAGGRPRRRRGRPRPRRVPRSPRLIFPRAQVGFLAAAPMMQHDSSSATDLLADECCKWLVEMPPLYNELSDKPETVTLDSVLDPVMNENIIVGGIPLKKVGQMCI